MSADSVPWDVQLRSEVVVGLLGDGVRRQREMRWAVRMRARLAEMSDAERKEKVGTCRKDSVMHLHLQAWYG